MKDYSNEVCCRILEWLCGKAVCNCFLISCLLILFGNRAQVLWDISHQRGIGDTVIWQSAQKAGCAHKWGHLVPPTALPPPGLGPPVLADKALAQDMQNKREAWSPANHLSVQFTILPISSNISSEQEITFPLFLKLMFEVQVKQLTSYKL